jgi:hypothetical protein
MRLKSFRYSMLIGALALGGVAIYYFANYVVLTIALTNNGLQASLKQSIEALWLAFACHGLLIALLYLIVAFKPHAVSREVIVILGLLQLVEAILLFSFSGSLVVAGLLIVAAVFVMVGALLWPKKLPPPAPPATVTATPGLTP